MLANYQPAEGLNCQGEPFVPPPDCEPGTAAVDTDADGWVESCRPLCPVPETGGEDGAAADGAAGTEAPGGDGCVPVCTGADSESPDCIPICGPDDADAEPGSCAWTGEPPGGPAADEPPADGGDPADGTPPADAADDGTEALPLEPETPPDTADTTDTGA